jgi:CBS domain-containing protein
MKVNDIMSRDVKTCHPDSTLAAAAAILWAGDCGIAPVVDGRGRMVGVITDRDICIAAGTRVRPTSELLVQDTMTKQVHVCAPGDDIRVAIKTMAERQVRRLPVIDETGALVGVLSLNDVVRCAEPVVSGRKPPDLSAETLLFALKSVCRRHGA